MLSSLKFLIQSTQEHLTIKVFSSWISKDSENNKILLMIASVTTVYPITDQATRPVGLIKRALSILKRRTTLCKSPQKMVISTSRLRPILIGWFHSLATVDLTPSKEQLTAVRLLQQSSLLSGIRTKCNSTSLINTMQCSL